MSRPALEEARGTASPGWVRLDGGWFVMGSDDFYPDEAPRHDREIAPFEIAATPVTNAEFARFVAATGHVTLAERSLSVEHFPELTQADRAAGSLVFTPTPGPVGLRDWRRWWRWVPGADWRHPGGPGSTTAGREDHPVVQVAYPDALAYCAWAGVRLPTEAEHEYAAGGGGVPRPYAWGARRDPGGTIMANTWRGRFPYRNEGAAGWVGTSPVGAFPANGFGLSDMIGNVWEWTSDRYLPRHSGAGSTAGSPCGCSPAAAEGRPAGRRVLKGGSHLCAPEYCLRYRPAARSPQAEDSATTHIGFRVARDAP